MSIFSENPYYHGTIRNLVIALGNLFSDINISKINAAGEREQQIVVPIAYGPKHKWLSRLKEEPDLSNNGKIEITLPRMAFEITDFRYAADRKVGIPGHFLNAQLGSGRTKLFNPVPYDVIFSVYSLTKSNEDSLQILEQILPYFSPYLNLEITILPEFNIKKTIPIVLSGVSVEDSYTGSPNEFRTITQTFSFVAKLDLFGPTPVRHDIIKTTIADVGTTIPDPMNLTVNDNNRYTATVNPLSANSTDIFTIDETWFTGG
jgi:hypothetical protein